MNKTDLIAVLEGRLGSRRAASEAVETFIATVQDAVAAGDRVTISGFGTFERVVRNARVGRNLRTGAAVEIPPTSLPRFRPGTAFRVQVEEAAVTGVVRSAVKDLPEPEAPLAPAADKPARVAKAPVKAVKAAVARPAVVAPKEAKPAKDKAAKGEKKTAKKKSSKK